MSRILCRRFPLVGPLTIEADGGAVTAIRFGGDPASREQLPGAEDDPDGALLGETVRQLEEYFAGCRRSFSLPLAPRGTPFQQAVWTQLGAIPYGETRSYGAVAAAVGRPHAARAVGRANNRNPIAIVVPCHRVVGASGALVGYAAGLGIKQRLLDLERSAGRQELRVGQASNDY